MHAEWQRWGCAMHPGRQQGALWAGASAAPGVVAPRAHVTRHVDHSRATPQACTVFLESTVQASRTLLHAPPMHMVGHLCALGPVH